jgi:hypothetical protein
MGTGDARGASWTPPGDEQFPARERSTRGEEHEDDGRSNTETTRVLETDSKTCGYTTVAEPNPSDPEHPRRLPVIEETEAALVRRVFEMYVAGATFKRIAATLNEEGIPAPHDGGPKGKDMVSPPPVA